MTLSTSAATAGALLPAGRWTVDGRRSSVRFSVRHLMVATVHGRFADVRGTIETTERGALYAAGAVTVASIHTGDPTRDHRLRSPGFFDAAAFPEIRFCANPAQPVACDDGDHSVTGDLTIGAETRPLTFNARATRHDDGLLVTATATLSRREHGLDWPGLLHAGKVAVSDRVEIDLELTLTG